MFVTRTLNYLSKLKVNNSLYVRNSMSDANKNDGNLITNKEYNKFINEYTQVTTLKNTHNVALSRSVLNVADGNIDTSQPLTNIVSDVASIHVDLDVVRYTIPQANGLQDIALILTAGQKLSMKLSSIDSDNNYVVVTDLLGLPSSLYFQRETSSIEGIPFVLGEYDLVAYLENRNKISIRLTIVPKDLT